MKALKTFFMMFINLQLFANMNINRTTDTIATTGNELSPEMKTFYDMTLIDEAGANLVHDQFGQKRPIPKNGGKTIEFRKFENLPKATTPLTEGVTPDGGQLNVSTITATVEQYGYYIVQSDMLELTALDNTILEATKLLGKQAGLTIDTIVRDILHTGTNVNYCHKVVSGTETEVLSRYDLDENCQLTVDEINQAVTKLRANNTPTINGDYVAIIHPYVSYDLRRDPEWVDAHKYTTSENIYSGEIGRVGGCRFVESTEAKIYKGASLASDSETLVVNNAAGYTAATTIAFDSGTVKANALVGREVIINGTHAEVTANTTTTITVDTAITCSDNAVIYPGEGGKNGLAVFGTLMFGADAYGVTDITGGGLETMVKQKGSAGTADPLDQRSSVGWKATKTAEILVPNYMVRIESCSKRYSKAAKAN